MRFRQCSNKACTSYTKLYNLAEHSVCPDCSSVSNDFTDHSNIMVGLKAASKGPLASYKPTGDTYIDSLMASAQENYL